MMKTLFDQYRRVHLVGIGGAGMEGLARLLAAKGCVVSGSDQADSPSVALLRQEGFAVAVGHDGQLVQGVDLVVYSAAVPADNPERQAAAHEGIPTASRAEVLGELSRAPLTLAVAGTHGKTTTASMAAAILRRAGLDPQVLIGGWINGRPQAESGSGEVFVVEADEFAGGFLHLYPSLALVTSIDAEHLDYYGSLEALERAFGQFLARLPFCGRSVLAGDGLVGERVLADLQRPHQTYGMAGDNDYRIAELEERTWGSRFALCFDGQKLGEIELVRNAAGAAALTCALQVEFAVIADALEQFGGADRRFQRKGEFAGVLVVDDYAHHPVELAAALAAARQSGRRVVAVFQPHLYSRTRDLAAAFACELAVADYVVLAAVYAAREAPLPGVDSTMIEEALRASGYKTVAYLPDREQLVAHLVDICRRGDLVLVMGAGDIGETAGELIAALAAGEHS
ncbi:MAG: UDP-N-acetylmuramate--L-alanine ligase [Candidatus Latescibacteria bacterium]|nr:UDP-N-acetylmuramate--L-alanine ligase [Candidatus Latescibacterota bacterium]